MLSISVAKSDLLVSSALSCGDNSTMITSPLLLVVILSLLSWYDTVATGAFCRVIPVTSNVFVNAISSKVSNNCPVNMFSVNSINANLVLSGMKRSAWRGVVIGGRSRSAWSEMAPLSIVR